MACPTYFLCLIFLSFISVNADGSFEFDNSDEYFDNPGDTVEVFSKLESPNEDYYEYLSVCQSYEDDTLYVRSDKECEDNNQVALGRYRNAVNESGWGLFEVETFPGYEPDIQAYAAGLAEGILTRQQIYYHYRNTVEDLCKGYKNYCKRLYDYLAKNLQWISETVKEKPETDLYWRHVNLTFAQLNGIYDGYSKKSTKDFVPAIIFEIHPIYVIQISGELIDLSKVFNKTKDPEEDPEPGRCSGFVKVSPGNKDLFFSHVAMSGYNTMNRVLKLYKFGYDSEEVPGYTQSFSGYAGALASADDYTLIGSGLASIETTIGIYNNTLYTDQFIKPVGQLHCWIRSIIANSLAATAREWTKIFARYNSGTYNNQWVVVDYKAFKPEEELPTKGLLWVLEQIPGYTMAKDMTWFLRKYSYFPSYNIPYFAKISLISGFHEEGKKQSWHNWAQCPRAKIFKRDHHKVVNIDELQKLMRYNDYQHEPFSRCKCDPPYSAEAGISARGDLNPINGTYEWSGMGHRNHGGLDFKGTNYTLFKQLRMRVWGGPTYDPLPVFSWDTTDIVTPHYGQPTTWNFTWIETNWETDVKADL